MHPHDIEEQVLPLPHGDRRSAVIISGDSLRHLQFGYQLQDRFPGLLKKWWIPDRTQIKPIARRKRAFEMLRNSEFNSISEFGSALVRVYGKLEQRFANRRYNRAQRDAEVRMFETDVKRLRRKAECHPTPIADFHGAALLDEILDISPYFLFSLGGALLKPSLFQAVRGLAINQHSGWSPEYKGSHTPHAALYHRDLARIGNTVHLLASGADSGAILRRSSVKIHADDSLHDVFMAAIALGSELTLEVLSEALEAENLPRFEQAHAGETFLAQDLSPTRLAFIERDFRNGWLLDTLVDEQNW